MPIYATNESKPREQVPTGNHIARCISMIHIGHVAESFNGETKIQNKVRITWEIPEELRVFDETKGEQPMVMSQEYTLSMNEKANLRKMLESWRGKAFTPEEAKKFDITVLVGIPCMLNVGSKAKKDNSGTYSVITAVTPLPKGMKAPAPITQQQVVTYDKWSDDVYNNLPEFIRTKIASSEEYQAMKKMGSTPSTTTKPEYENDLPF